MATRNTRQEAEEVAKGIRARHPEWIIVVNPKGDAWEVAEMRTCARCGKQFKTIAIGEIDNPWTGESWCMGCKAVTAKEQLEASHQHGRDEWRKINAVYQPNGED